MTEVELAVIVKALGPLVRETVIAALKDVDLRVKTLEARPIVDAVQGPPGERGDPGPAGERGPEGVQGTPGRDGRDGLPGVPGAPGEKGMDGRNGLDGKDGLGFGELAVEHDGERTFTVKAVNGERVKALGSFVVPLLLYRGVYQESKSYDPGDVATWAGSLWHCNEQTTAKPGEGTKAWTLCVKKGRDGRDGQDGSPPSPPVVKVN